MRETEFVRCGRAVHEHDANVAGGLVEAGVLQILLTGEHLQTILHNWRGKNARFALFEPSAQT